MGEAEERVGLTACGTVDGRVVYSNAPAMDAATAGAILARALIARYGGEDKLREAIMARGARREA